MLLFGSRMIHVYSTSLKISDGSNIDWYKKVIFFLLWRCDPTRVMASPFLRFLDYTQRLTTVGRTPLDE